MKRFQQHTNPRIYGALLHAAWRVARCGWRDVWRGRGDHGGDCACGMRQGLPSSGVPSWGSSLLLCFSFLSLCSVPSALCILTARI